MRRALQRSILPSCFLILVHGISAHADDLQIHGFGNLVGSQSDSQYPFEYSSFHGDYLNVDSESLLGINLSSALGGSTTFAGQVLAQGNDNGDYHLHADWLFLTYKADDNWILRGGRQINPLFLYSEQIDVGFNYLWVRTPYEVYSLLPIRSVNGISLIYNKMLDNLLFRAEFLVGDGDFSIVQPGATYTATTSLIKSIELSLSSETFKVRATYLAAKTATASVVTNQVIPNTGGSSETFTTPVDVGLLQLASVGGTFDNKKWLLTAEAAHQFADGTLITSGSGAYATIGYHIANFIPYITGAWKGDEVGTAYVD